MTTTNLETAKEIVKRAKRRAALNETSIILSRLDGARRQRLAKKAVAVIDKTLGRAKTGRAASKQASSKKEAYGQPVAPAASPAAGGAQPCPGSKINSGGAGRGLGVGGGRGPMGVPVGAKKPGVPAPAAMKSQPTSTTKLKPASPPAASQAQPYLKASEELMAELLIKAADDTRNNRKDAFEKAARAYNKAIKSGDKEIIKKAIARMAAVTAFDVMTKEALTGQIGAAIMKLLSKLTPYAGKAARGLGRPGAATKITDWGGRMGHAGSQAAELLKTNPEWLPDLIAAHPELVQQLTLAKQVGTGTLAGGAGFMLGGLGRGEGKDKVKPKTEETE